MFAPSHISLHQHRLIFWQPGMFLNRKDDDVTYSSGSLEIKGLRYTGATNSAAEHFQYGLRSGTILKHLIAVPDELLMVGFNFEPKDKRWQGCRDFMYYICFCSHHNDANYELLSTQYHYNLVLRGIILDPEASFYEHVGFVYIKGSAPIRRAVEYCGDQTIAGRHMSQGGPRPAIFWPVTGHSGFLGPKRPNFAPTPAPNYHIW